MKVDIVDKVVIGQFCYQHHCAVNIFNVVGEDEIQYVVVAIWLIYQLQ